MRTTRRPAVLRAAAALWILAGIWYLGVEAVVAQHFPGYSYATNYISDLGRPWQSPLAGWMNSAFIAQGLAFALAATLAVAVVRPGRGAVAFVALAWVYGLGCVIVGVFPSGGADTVMHGRGATAAIVAGNLAILAAGVLARRCRVLGVAGLVLGIVGLGCGALLVSGNVSGLPMIGEGARERGAIYTIIGWQLLAGVTLLVRPAAPTQAVTPPGFATGSGSGPTARP